MGWYHRWWSSIKIVKLLINKYLIMSVQVNTTETAIPVDFSKTNLMENDDQSIRALSVPNGAAAAGNFLGTLLEHPDSNQIGKPVELAKISYVLSTEIVNFSIQNV